MNPKPDAIFSPPDEKCGLKQLGDCDDIANTAMFLASPMASFISGVILPVDGGWSLNGAGLMMETLARQLTTGN